MRRRVRAARCFLRDPLVSVPAAALVAALLVVAGGGCGGSGGGGGPTSPPPPTPGITFTPSTSAGSPGISLVAGPGSTASSLILQVRATGIQDLYGIAFDLQLPAGVLQFSSSSSTGSILSGGAFELSHTASDLVVGVTLLGAVAGVSGNGVILTLAFTPTATGSGSFAFSRNTVLDSTGRPIPGVSWSAGSVQVVH